MAVAKGLSLQRHVWQQSTLLERNQGEQQRGQSVARERNGQSGQRAAAYPNWKQPSLLEEPLKAAFQYIHQKFFVLTSAFQCDLHSPAIYFQHTMHCNASYSAYNSTTPVISCKYMV